MAVAQPRAGEPAGRLPDRDAGYLATRIQAGEIAHLLEGQFAAGYASFVLGWTPHDIYSPTSYGPDSDTLLSMNLLLVEKGDSRVTAV